MTACRSRKSPGGHAWRRRGWRLSSCSPATPPGAAQVTTLPCSRREAGGAGAAFTALTAEGERMSRDGAFKRKQQRIRQARLMSRLIQAGDDARTS